MNRKAPAKVSRNYLQASAARRLRSYHCMVNLSAGVRALVDRPNYAHIATLMPDGAPHTVPVWIGIDAGRIVFLTDPRSQKALNLGRDPRLAFSLTDREQPNRMAQIRGRVVERIDGDEAWAIIDRLSDKYLGTPYPIRSDRIVYVVAVDTAWGQEF